jgi:hypothetical protein
MTFWDRTCCRSLSKFINGTLPLLPAELEHLQMCDECSDLWWKTKHQERGGKGGADWWDKKSA